MPVLLPAEIESDIDECRENKAHFTRHHVYFKDGEKWVPFRLWKFQGELLNETVHHKQMVLLKARQLGLTWVALADTLHTMLFTAGATCLLFSLRDQEAKELLERLTGMYDRLSPAYKFMAEKVKSSVHSLVLDNGSRALAFPTGTGDSYTAALAVVDEADLVPDLGDMLGRVKPTVDAGGRLILLSRVDKATPQSAFKQLYRSAKTGEAPGWAPRFFAWNLHPGRSEAWYDEQKAFSMAQTGSLDYLHEQYPATAEEALAPRSLDKRFPISWLLQCYKEIERERGIGTKTISLPSSAPSLPHLGVYKAPEAGKRYYMGADPAEGNPNSDDSAAFVIDDAGEECARLVGKIEYQVFAQQVDRLGQWYNRASVLVERNNHGHGVLTWLTQNSTLMRLKGHTKKFGWESSQLGKSILYDAAADALRCGECIIHSFSLQQQLASIEANTLRAPEGQMDDESDAFCLSLMARLKGRGIGEYKLESY